MARPTGLSSSTTRRHPFFEMARPSLVNFDQNEKYWMCGNPTCHTPLVLQQDYCGKLFRGGIYSGFCLFQNLKSLLCGAILIEGKWRGQQVHCIGCTRLLGGKFIEVPPERLGDPSKSGRYFLKMAKVCFSDGSRILDADAILLAQTVFKLPETMADPSMLVQVDSVQWVHLNVGGKVFLTTIDTLTRESSSMLEAMFSGRHKLKEENGYVLIDRDGSYFPYILRWLRDGVVPILEPMLYPELLLEAKYYQLSGLIAAVEEVILQLKADLSRHDMVRSIQSGTLSFVGFNFWGQDLSKLDLAKADFTGACLHNVSFEATNLRNVKLQNCDCQYAVFDSALLEASLMCKGNFSGASFVAAKLHKSNMTGATLVSSNLTNANLWDVEATECKFNGATCENAVFHRGMLSDGSFEEANLSASDLSRATLSRCNFKNADLRNANLQDANLTDAELYAANLSGCRLSRAELQNANLEGANLTNANLGEAKLQNANMRNTILSAENYQVALNRGAIL